MCHLTEDELLACKTSESDELDKALETEEIPKRDQSEAKRMQAENPMNDGGVDPSGAINREQNSARTDAMTNKQRNYEIPTQKFPNVTEAEWQAIQTICRKRARQQKRWRLAGTTRHCLPPLLTSSGMGRSSRKRKGPARQQDKPQPWKVHSVCKKGTRKQVAESKLSVNWKAKTGRSLTSNH